MTPVPPTAGSLDPTGHETLEIISRAGAFNRWMYETIRPFLKGEILEIGSGIGNISDYVVKAGYPVTLTDYNPAYCHVLREKYSGAPNVRNILSIDLQHNDFKAAYASLEACYDAIFMLNVIEHLEDDHRAVRNCAWLLKPEGRLILLAPAYRFLFSRLDKELGHYRRYRTKDFVQLLEQQQFRVLRSDYFNALGLLGWLVYGRIAGQKQLRAGEFNAFNKLVPVARLLDRLSARKAGLSVIAVGEKKS